MTLTLAGQELLARAQTLIGKSENEGFAGVPDADIKATVRTLKTLHLKLSAQPPTRNPR